MDTDHLFNTFCMIYNHANPNTPIASNTKRYSFRSDTHPPGYLARAAIEILKELTNRSEELGPKQNAILRYIFSREKLSLNMLTEN